MKKIRYILQRLKNMNYKNMFKTVSRVSEKTKKSKIKIFFDMVWCGIKHQAGYVDYEFYTMYNLTEDERKTIMTRGRSNHYVAKLNPKSYWHFFDNKDEFNQKFSKYLNRDWMYLNENNFDEFKKFIKKHEQIIVKPNNLSCGKGVRKINVSEYDSKELYEELIKNETYLIEEVARQHKGVSVMHPTSVNTIRISTLISDYGVTSVVGAVFRIGTNNKVVDNFNNDGICAMVDVETGKVNSLAINAKGEIFKKHPTTGVKIEGFQIPMWDEIVKLVKETSKVVKEMRLIGWDICVGEDGPLIIEANQFPAHNLYQPLFGEGDKTGVVPIFEEAIKRKK